MVGQGEGDSFTTHHRKRSCQGLASLCSKGKWDKQMESVCFSRTSFKNKQDLRLEATTPCTHHTGSWVISLPPSYMHHEQSSSKSLIRISDQLQTFKMEPTPASCPPSPLTHTEPNRSLSWPSGCHPHWLTWNFG